MSQIGTEQANYMKAINSATAIVAASDTSDLDAKEVAANIGDLAAEIAKVQDKYFKDNGFEGTSFSAPRSGGGGGGYKKSSGGGGSFDPGTLSPKQEAALDKAFKAITERGDVPPHTKEEILSLSSEGGQASPRSQAIGAVFDAGFKKF